MAKRALIIGGGISGLVAARGLAEKGFEVSLLEAKERLGGRILTTRIGAEIAELGAEFIHGDGGALVDALREAGLALIPASNRNRIFRHGALSEIDLWGRAEKVIGSIDPKIADEPFASFLERSDFDAETKNIALGFVQGFNAADAAIIGSHSLLRADYSAGEEGSRQRRVVEGYGVLVDRLAQRAAKAGVTLRANTRVSVVRWRRGGVQVETNGPAYEGDVAVVTLPLGVLKARRVRFEPSLTHKQEAIESMQFGDVVKIVFVFRAAWWGNDFGFIHDFGEQIPTWWSDPRGPVLVGWAAGPKGDALAGNSIDELQAIGLRILEKLLGAKPRDLLSVHHHDWRHDHDIGGAYSYIPVNGLDLPKSLAAPIEDTLFFAGEATAMDAQMGTVSGAVESGLRVVDELTAHA